MKNNLKISEVSRIKFAVTITESIAAGTPFLLEGDPSETIKKAAQLGYDGVEVHWPKPSLIDMDKISKACEENNIEISAFGTGQAYTKEGISLIDQNKDIRKKAINRLKEFADIASTFNSIVVIGLIRGDIPMGGDKDEYLKLLAQSTIEASEYAEKKGVTIVFEAINRYENNYLNNALETLEFIEKYQLPNTKLHIDTFHMNIEDKDMIDTIKKCNDRIGYVHFADSNRHFLGEGHIDFKKVLNALKAIKYNGFISAECLPLPDAYTAARRWIEEAKSL